MSARQMSRLQAQAARAEVNNAVDASSSEEDEGEAVVSRRANAFQVRGLHTASHQRVACGWFLMVCLPVHVHVHVRVCVSSSCVAVVQMLDSSDEDSDSSHSDSAVEDTDNILEAERCVAPSSPPLPPQQSPLSHPPPAPTSTSATPVASVERNADASEPSDDDTPSQSASSTPVTKKKKRRRRKRRGKKSKAAVNAETGLDVAAGDVSGDAAAAAGGGAAEVSIRANLLVVKKVCVLTVFHVVMC